MVKMVLVGDVRFLENYVLWVFEKVPGVLQGVKVVQRGFQGFL